MDSQYIIDRQGIEEALANHSRGVDRADAALLSTAYHEDAVVDYGSFVGPAGEFVSFVTDAHKTGIISLHRTSNISIRINGTKAVSESYATAYVEVGGIQRLVLGRYLDSHEKRDGVWRLTKRMYTMEGNTNKPSNAMRPDPAANDANFVPQGGQGAADPGRVLLAFAQADARADAQADTKADQNTSQETESMTEKTDQSEIDIALSKIAIHELCMSYSRAVDRANSDLLASLFTEDATVISGVFNGPAKEFTPIICEHVRTNTDYVFHSIANEWIKVSGDEAVGEHYVIAMMQADGHDVMTGGRYIDRYRRDKGEWKIKERTFVMDWNRSDPTTAEVDGFYEGLDRHARWGKEDPVFALWDSLG